jgi:hypothetical protein
MAAVRWPVATLSSASTREGPLSTHSGDREASASHSTGFPSRSFVPLEQVKLSPSQTA